MSRPKQVLLLIESSRAYGRGCLSGVASYARTHRHWRVRHVEWSLTEAIPRALRESSADGILARIETRRMAEAIAKLSVPTVDLMGAYRPSGGGFLDTDPRLCARLAADHFLARGFRHLAYCGYPGVWFSDQRGHFFLEALDAYERQVSVSEHTANKRPTDGIITRERRGEFREADLIPWLLALPKPVAVFACNDIRGRQVLASCERAGLTVPDDVAVLGVDNDLVICDLSVPPLSSIEPDTTRIGYEGAAMLDRLMAGEPAPDEAVLIPPKKIHTRLSSDVLAVEDRDMAAALRFIRDHACDQISVGMVARQLAMSRTSLDRHFQRLVGRTVKAEINRLRVKHAKQLLDETEYKIGSIAEMAGFGTAPQFVTAFKRLTGQTPGEYRAR